MAEPEVAATIASQAVTSSDAYIAWDVLSHTSCHASMTEADKHAMAEIIESSGLHRATMPEDLLDDLMASVRISEAELAQLLGQDVRTW